MSPQSTATIDDWLTWLRTIELPPESKPRNVWNRPLQREKSACLSPAARRKIEAEEAKHDSD